MRAILFVLVLAIGTSLVASRPAHACSCVGPRLTRTVVPRDGTPDFPVDGRLRIFTTGFPERLREELGRDYRLKDDGGALVPFTQATVGTMIELVPSVPLRPNVDYVLEQAFVFLPDGVQITDTHWFFLVSDRAREPLAFAPRRAFFPLVHFRTAAASPARTVEVPPIKSAEVEYAYGGGDCGPATTLSLSAVLPAGLASTDVVELEVGHKGVVFTRPAPIKGQDVDLGVSDELCAFDKIHLGKPEKWTVRVHVTDAVGRRVGSSEWFTPSGGAYRSPWGRDYRDPIDEPQRQRDERSNGRLPPWFEIAEVPAPSGSKEGIDTAEPPTACPYGVEVVVREPLVADERAPLAQGLPDVPVKASDAIAARLERLKVEGPTSVRSPVAWNSSIAQLPTGFLAVEAREDARPGESAAGEPFASRRTRSRVVATWFDLQGKARRSTVVDSAGFNNGVAIKAEGQRALIVWDSHRDWGHLEHRLAVLDLKTWKVQARFAGDIEPSSLGFPCRPSMVVDGSGFVVLWTGESGANHLLVTYDPVGGLRKVPLALPRTIGGAALAARAGKLYLVSVDLGRTRFNVLDRKTGALSAGQLLSVGLPAANYFPSAVPALGGVLACWTRELKSVVCTVVDEDGRAALADPVTSPDLEAWRSSLESSEAAPVVTVTNLLANSGESMTLACRSRPVARTVIALPPLPASVPAVEGK